MNIMNNIVCICRPQADYADHRKGILCSTVGHMMIQVRLLLEKRIHPIKVKNSFEKLEHTNATKNVPCQEAVKAELLTVLKLVILLSVIT
jgi:hypothetical protein